MSKPLLNATVTREKRHCPLFIPQTTHNLQNDQIIIPFSSKRGIKLY